MKKILKLSLVLLITFMIIMSFSSVVNAGSIDWKTSINNMYTASGNTSVNTSVQSIVGAIIVAARVIAVGVAIIMLTVIAMKYMMASAGDKADIKKHAVVYVVGAVVLFAASGILGIIAQFASAIS